MAQHRVALLPGMVQPETFTGCLPLLTGNDDQGKSAGLRGDDG
jgi:hypothetical protein